MNTSPGSPLQSPDIWSAAAQGYAEEATGHMVHYAERALDMARVTANDRIVDVACGTGALALTAAPRVARVVAVDFSEGMLTELRAEAARKGISNVETHRMKAEHLQLADAAFDAAFCMFGFMFFPDRHRAFCELHRVVRTDGAAVIATWSPIDRRPMLQVGLEAMREVLPDIPPPPKGELQQTDECEREMRNAGFRNVRAECFTASLFVESAARYVRMLERAGGTMVALKNKLGPQAWALMIPRLVSAVERRLPAGGAELPAEAILTIGTR